VWVEEDVALREGDTGEQGKGQADAFLKGLKDAAPTDVDDLIKQLKDAAKSAGLPADMAEAWLKAKVEDGKVDAEAMGKQVEDKLKTTAHFIPGEPKDLIKQVEQIKDAGTITKSQQETLDGQQVVHYWIDVDVEKLAAQQTDAMMKSAMESLAKQGTKTLKYELWVRGDGLPAKFATQAPVGAGKPVTVTVGFSDWGQPVNVQAPPADQVGEMPKMGG